MLRQFINVNNLILNGKTIVGRLEMKITNIFRSDIRLFFELNFSDLI